MGEDNKPTCAVAYIDGKLVDVNMDNLQEIAMAPEEDLPPVPADPGGIYIEAANKAAATLAEAFRLFTVSLNEAVAAVTAFWEKYREAAELETAMCWAKAANPKLAHIYHHTKKKRTRKKAAKRILAWYREEVL